MAPQCASASRLGAKSADRRGSAGAAGGSRRADDRLPEGAYDLKSSLHGAAQDLESRPASLPIAALLAADGGGWCACERAARGAGGEAGSPSRVLGHGDVGLVGLAAAAAFHRPRQVSALGGGIAAARARRRLLRRVFPVKVTQNLAARRWSKLALKLRPVGAGAVSGFRAGPARGDLRHSLRSGLASSPRSSRSRTSAKIQLEPVQDSGPTARCLARCAAARSQLAGVRRRTRQRTGMNALLEAGPARRASEDSQLRDRFAR